MILQKISNYGECYLHPFIQFLLILSETLPEPNPQYHTNIIVKLLYVFFWVFPRRPRTPGKYPKEYIQYSKHGESLKSRLS